MELSYEDVLDVLQRERQLILNNGNGNKQPAIARGSLFILDKLLVEFEEMSLEEDEDEEE